MVITARGLGRKKVVSKAHESMLPGLLTEKLDALSKGCLTGPTGASNGLLGPRITGKKNPHLLMLAGPLRQFDFNGKQLT